MNHPNIVQQNIEIPVAGSTQGVPGKPVAAIIRPKARKNGGQTSTRRDASTTARSRPHIRSSEFQEYVEWLQAKFQMDETGEGAANSSDESTNQDAASKPGQLKPMVSEIVSTLVATQGTDLPESLFSTITTAAVAATEAGIPIRSDNASETRELKPEPKLDSVASSEAHERVDQPHAGLPQAYVSFDELKAGDTRTPTVRIASDQISALPAASKSRKPVDLTAQDTEHFVSTMSKAIASVLTETPELEFEHKVKALFESELHARAADTEMLELKAEIRSTEPTHIAAATSESTSELVQQELPTPVMESQVDTKPATTEILTSARTEIPTTAAAWDVEDFRWPVVTNQMIVAGSEALDQLCESMMDMVTPTNQRVAIAGLGRGEGTTSIALSLARWAVARGNNVLVIDADLVSPGLTTQVGLAPSLSWIQAVTQSLDPAEVTVRSQKSNLCIMPLAEMVSRSTWPRFIYDSLGEMIAPIQNHFDLVILDVGPANQLMAELSRPSLLVDATLLVHNGVNTPEFQTTKNRLEMFGLHRFIVAQNRAHQRTSANVA